MKHITVAAAIIHDDENRIFATQRGFIIENFFNTFENFYL